MKWFVIKEKAICQELNKLSDDGEKFLTGLFWCPSKYQNILDEKISEMRSRKASNGGP